jgi:hypothetical protein
VPMVRFISSIFISNKVATAGSATQVALASADPPLGSHVGKIEDMLNKTLFHANQHLTWFYLSSCGVVVRNNSCDFGSCRVVATSS